MEDHEKTNAMLLSEIARLRRRVAALEFMEGDRQQGQEAFMENEKRLRSIFHDSAVGTVIVAPTGQYLQVNHAFCEFLGYAEHELIGQNALSFTHPDDRKIMADALKEAFASGPDIQRLEKRYIHKTGRVLWGEVSARLICDAEGKPSYHIGQIVDITERKRAEELLKKAHEELEQHVEERTAELTVANRELQTVYDGMLDGLLVADLETTQFVRANAAICRLLGYTQQELLTMTVADIHPPEIVPLVQEKFHSQRIGEKLLSENRPVLRKDGTVFFADISNTSIEYHGRPCIIGLFRDITERKVAEEALRQSEEKYRGLLEICPDAVVMADLQGKAVFVSKQTWRLLGVPDSVDLIGRKVYEFVVPSDQKRAIEGLLRMAEVGKIPPTEYMAVRYDGTTVPTEISAVLGWDANGKPVTITAVIRDITERKQAEEKIRKEHRTLRHLLQSSDHERQLIAYEIHDGLAQQLAGAIMQFQSYGHQKDKNPCLAAKAFDAGMTMLQQGHFEARRLIAGVRPPILDESGVLAAVGHLINEHNRTKGPRIEYRTRVDFDRLTSVVENAIYRIVQEGLANACQHSKSDRVRVSLVQRDDRIEVTVRDWGVGFDTKVAQENRFGLEGIRQRVRLLGGKCNIHSKKDKGVRILVDLPVVSRD
jgi:PAS domain S-box-containing protein